VRKKAVMDGFGSSCAMPGDRMKGRYVLGLLIIFLTISIFIAPFLTPPNSVGNLSGRTINIDNDAVIRHMPLFPMLVYYFGDFNCHQKSDRSFYLNGNQMPVCARDVGALLGLSVSYWLILWSRLRYHLLLTLGLLLPMLVDGLLQQFTLYQSTNFLRIMTGALGGIGLAFILMMIFELVLTGKDQEPEGQSVKRIMFRW
jgi:uncharacterized membrane protein